MRRLMCIVIAAVLVVPVMKAVAAKEFEGTTLNVNGYGGAFDDVLKATVAKPLKDKYGIEVVYHPGTGLQAVAKVMASKDNPPLDVLMVDSPNMPTLMEAGIIEAVTEQEVPNLRQVYKEAREFGNQGVPFMFAPMVLAWNTQRVKTPPAAIADLARPEYKGRATIFNLENNGGILTLLALAEANGGGVNNIGPGFAKLKELKPNLVSTPAANPALVQLFQQGEAWVAYNWIGRALSLQAEGFPLQIAAPKEGLYTVVSYVNLVKGAKQRAAALKYLDQMISEEASRGMAAKFFYAPTNASAKLPPDLAQKILVVGPENIAKIRRADWAAIAKNRGPWIEQWNREMR
jgi:putative spermidine/putrescine transport system substrate-binding protein